MSDDIKNTVIMNPTYPWPNLGQPSVGDPYPYNPLTPTMAPLYQPTIFTLPPRFGVPNKQVAVEPFPAQAKDRNRVKGGVLEVANSSNLVKLKVVFSSESFQEGQYVYVRSKIAQSTTYGQEVFEAEDRKFILLPEHEIVLVERYPESAYATISGSLTVTGSATGAK
jgi:hypothetical protein